MVERLDRRVEEALRSHHFVSRRHWKQTLLHYVWLYNHRLPRAGLIARTSMLKDWYRPHAHFSQIYI